MNCPKCGSDKNISRGKSRNKKNIIRMCKICGRKFSVPIINNISNILDNKNIDDLEQDNQKEVIVQDIYKLSDLIKYSEIDTSIWNIDKHIINKWAGNWQVKAFLSKVKPDKQIIPIINPIRFNFKSKDLVYNTKSNIKKTIIFGDSHIGFLKNQQTGELNPFHDRKCIDVIYKIINYINPDEVILNGDMLDMTEAGKFEKKKEFYFTLQPAINEFGYILSWLRSFFHGKIIYLAGNHCIRINKLIREHLLHSFQIKAYNSTEYNYSLSYLLGLKDLNIDFLEDYPSSEYFINNELKVIHGEFVDLKKELLRTDISIIQNHIHRVERYSKTFSSNKGIKQITVASLGCTCKIDGTVPGAVSHPDWQMGLGYIESTDNRFNIQHIAIVDGKCIFNGKMFEGEDYSDILDEMGILKL